MEGVDNPLKTKEAARPKKSQPKAATSGRRQKKKKKSKAHTSRNFNGLTPQGEGGGYSDKRGKEKRQEQSTKGGKGGRV